MKKHCRLGVNIDHVAMIRQARGERYPDPVAAAIIAELAGADQITCHLRGDRRHIIDSDIPRLRDAAQTQLNVEIAPTQEMLDIVCSTLSVHPWRHRVTLVPEREGEVTTEGGLDVCSNRALIEDATKALYKSSIHISLFIDPSIEQVRASQLPHVDMIELNTARYAERHEGELQRLIDAARYASSLGLEVAAGHGLTHHNLGLLVQNAPEIIEYNIGHSIVARSLFVGFEQAVRDIIQLIQQ